MHWRQLMLLTAVALLAACGSDNEGASAASTSSLFDGNALTGWVGSAGAFRAEGGAIIAGSQERGLTQNFYLCTDEEYSDFDLSVSVKLIHENLTGNSGISFRANESRYAMWVASYQADIGYVAPDVVARATSTTPADMVSPFSLWGSLKDEGREDNSRYPEPSWWPGVLLKWPERGLIDEIVKPHDWNTVEVAAHGPEIEIRVNGVTTIEFVEDLDVPTAGSICLEAHYGAPYEAHFKDINIRELD